MDENNEVIEETTNEETANESEIREVPKSAAIGMLVLAGVGAVALVKGAVRLTRDRIIPGVRAFIAAGKEKNEKKSEESEVEEEPEDDKVKPA